MEYEVRGIREGEWLMACRLDRVAALEIRRAVPDDVPGLVEMRIAQLLEE